MAVYYFRNTGNTDWGTSTNWSLTDGGGATGAVPTTADDAYFTANSGNATVTVTNKVCNSLITTGFNGTISCTTALTISGNVTLSATTTIAGTGFFSFSSATSNTYTRNSATINVDNVRVVGTGTYTFADTWNVKTFIFSSAGATLNGSTLNVSTDLTMSQTSGAGTTQINLTGTGTWSGTGILRNNLTINTAGTITISGSVAYNTGTLTYTAGTVIATGSTLNIAASTTLNTGTIVWNNIVTSGTTTLTLTGNLNTTNLTISGTLSFTLGGNILSVSGTLSLTNTSATTFNVPQNLQVTNLLLGNGLNNFAVTMNGLFTISVSGNLTLNLGNNVGLAISSGTTSILLNGTGTWSNTNIGVVQNNLTINTVGTITVSGSIYYNTGTLTYTAGTVTTTGSTLNVGASTTFNTSTMSWNNIIFTAGTQTLSSNLNIGGNLTTQTSAIVINGLFNVNVGGNFTMSETTSGTADIIMVGTGTVTGTVAKALSNNLTINTTGRIVFAQALWMAGTKTIKHIAGDTFVNYGHILQLSSIGNITSLDCAAILWDTLQLGNGANLTLLDNVYLRGNFDRLSNPSSITGNKSIYVGGGLSSVTYAMNGSATFVLTGSGNISLPVDFGFKIILNTSGKYTLTNNFLFNGTDFTVFKGIIISNGYAFYIRNTSTLINCHKINFDNIIITSGITLTMNEFFSGSPALKTTISPSSTTNYTITFQDNFEKITKFVTISGATITRRNQLLVITDSKKSSTNSGIRYINSLPNGIAKGDPSIQNILTPGLNTFLISDPAMSFK